MAILQVCDIDVLLSPVLGVSGAAGDHLEVTANQIKALTDIGKLQA